MQIVGQSVYYDCTSLYTLTECFSWSFIVLRIKNWIALFGIFLAVFMKIQFCYGLTSQEDLKT